MEKIKRFRITQPFTLDEFILQVIDNPRCHLCNCLNECTEYMGPEVMEQLEEHGCKAFDADTDELTKHYLLKYCQQTIGT